MTTALAYAPRALGALTAAYGISAVLRPGTIAKYAALDDPADPGPAVRMLSTAIGLRDIASGTSMMLAPRGRPLRVALGLRVAFDAGDAIAFGTLGGTARARTTVAAVALGWGALCAVSALGAGER
jgi:hypothetical protein